jgi:ABC-type multidrug transport system ATPase subunit
MVEPENGTERVIELRRVTKRYGKTLALDAVSLSIPRGKVLGLIGPNGAGKTTTLSLIAGFARPSSGSIRLFGGKPGARPRMGVFAQRAALPKRETVEQFLLYLAKLQRLECPLAAVSRVLEQVGAEHVRRARCGDLSYGMAKRVCLAQALLGDPEVVLLDEPTAGVDVQGVSETMKVLQAFRGTMVLASHNLGQVEGLCDEVLMLDQGRVADAISMRQVRERAYIQVRVSHWHLPQLAIAALDRHWELQLLPDICELRLRAKPGANEPVSSVLSVLIHHDVPVTSVNDRGKLQQHLDSRIEAITIQRKAG